MRYSATSVYVTPTVGSCNIHALLQCQQLPAVTNTNRKGALLSILTRHDRNMTLDLDTSLPF
jgi:hypothetical protein